ncbi:MAG: hypothetical protein V4685_05170 [Bacteroidota bacterium]
MKPNQQLTFDINAPVKKIYNLLKLVIIINILFLIGTWLSSDKVIMPNSETAQWWLSEFNFAKENVGGAWYSSMLFLTTGIVAALCFWADMQRASEGKMRLLNYGWLLMSGIFIMLSFDEMGSFHEMISQTTLFTKAGGGHGKKVLFIIIGAVAIFMGAFFFTKFKKDKLALLLTIFGLLLFLSNPFQEKFEIQSWRTSPDPSAWHRPIGFLLLEEGSEIFASFCFLFSFITYAINAAPGVNGYGEKILKLTAAANKYFIFWLGALAALLGILMLVIHMNAWNIPGDDDGLPQDWPPAAIALAAFAAAMYLFYKESMKANRPVYMVVAVTALFTSAYFGSYMYGYWEGPFAKMPVVFLGITIVAGLLAIVKLKDVFTKLILAAWVGFMILSFLRKEFSSAVYGYAACTCLLLALSWHYKTQATPVTE